MAGAGYKLFNTGDVLTAAQVNTYLQEQVVMVFNDATARTTALSGVLAEGMVTYLKSTKVVEIYNGTAWASLDDPNAIQNTIVDAKGDLITATANDTPARLAAGNNGDTLVCDSSTSTGLRYIPSPTIAQPVINGGMDLWQRGTSIAGTGASQYCADRWQMGANTASTVSRQATGDTTNLPFIQYSARVQRTNGSTSTTRQTIVTSIESANSIPFAGKTITLSFYARAGANYSATGSALGTGFYTGTGTDQNIFSGFTGQASSFGSSTLTTTWQRFTQTITMGATATQLAVQFYYDPPAGTAGANDWFEVTGVQIDAGNVALPFRRSGGTLGGELQAAQRYYQILGNGASAQPIGLGSYYTTTDVYCDIPLKVTMRTAPTLTFSGGATGASVYVAGSIRTSTATATQVAQTDITQIKITTAADTAGRVGNCYINGNATLAFSSEL